MKRMLLAVSFSLATSDAFAVSRYDISNMTCARVQALVEAEGAVILSYPSTSILGLPIYDRYVRSQSYCASNEVLRKAGVPTIDKKYCQVSKCVESEIFVSG